MSLPGERRLELYSPAPSLDAEHAATWAYVYVRDFLGRLQSDPGRRAQADRDERTGKMRVRMRCFCSGGSGTAQGDRIRDGELWYEVESVEAWPGHDEILLIGVPGAGA